jgi:hypothetical protein
MAGPEAMMLPSGRSEKGIMRPILILVWLLSQVGQVPAQPDLPTHDEQVLKSAGIKITGPALLDFFRRRTLTDKDMEQIQDLVRALGSDKYREREQAAQELVNRGPVVVEMLRAALKSNDLEVSRRAAKCLQRIQEADYAREVPAAAARLLAVRKPAGTAAVLLAFLPFAENEILSDEVRTTLTAVAIQNGKASRELIEALQDRSPLRKAAAAEALCRAGAKDHMPAIRKLLHDPSPIVRLRVGMTLAQAKEREAVPVLIDLLPELPLVHAWQAEDLLYRLAEGLQPPMISLGNDKAGHQRCRDAWAAWWKEHGNKVDLARLADAPRLLGYTLVVLLDQGQVMEVNARKERLWTIDGLNFPLDVQRLHNGHILVAEYHASRVSERNTKGEIVWQKRIIGPLVCQRLPNGNTFIATDAALMEYDPSGKEVMALTLPGERIMKAMKLPNGEIACLTSGERIVRLDAKGKELNTFPVNLSMKLFGGRIHMLTNGHVLVPHNGENKVVEYNASGKPVWEVAVDQPIAAMRLPNGNTLVTSMVPTQGAIEFDRAGRVVWQYQAGTRLTRALRR